MKVGLVGKSYSGEGGLSDTKGLLMHTYWGIQEVSGEGDAICA